MNEDYACFSNNLLLISEDQKLELLTDHYSIKHEFFENNNYLIEEDFKTELINMIFEMEKSIQIFINSSTKDSSGDISENMQFLNNPKKNCVNNRFNKVDNSDKIYKPRPVSNNISKRLFNSNKNFKILIAKRVQVKKTTI